MHIRLNVCLLQREYYFPSCFKRKEKLTDIQSIILLLCGDKLSETLKENTFSQKVTGWLWRTSECQDEIEALHTHTVGLVMVFHPIINESLFSDWWRSWDVKNKLPWRTVCCFTPLKTMNRELRGRRRTLFIHSRIWAENGFNLLTCLLNPQFIQPATKYLYRFLCRVVSIHAGFTLEQSVYLQTVDGVSWGLSKVAGNTCCCWTQMSFFNPLRTQSFFHLHWTGVVAQLA